MRFRPVRGDKTAERTPEPPPLPPLSVVAVFGAAFVWFAVELEDDGVGVDLDGVGVDLDGVGVDLDGVDLDWLFLFVVVAAAAAAVSLFVRSCRCHYRRCWIAVGVVVVRNVRDRNVRDRIVRDRIVRDRIVRVVRGALRVLPRCY